MLVNALWAVDLMNKNINKYCLHLEPDQRGLGADGAAARVPPSSAGSGVPRGAGARQKLAPVPVAAR